jgi:hypothetical protein
MPIDLQTIAVHHLCVRFSLKSLGTLEGIRPSSRFLLRAARGRIKVYRNGIPLKPDRHIKRLLAYWYDWVASQKAIGSIA